jgi:hypothetical protein
MPRLRLTTIYGHPPTANDIAFVDAFRTEGAVTTFLESVPVAGYGVSAVHAIAGNESHAKRAAARTTNSTVAFAVGLGTVVATGGSAAVVIGAGAAAGAVGSALGGASQLGIESCYTEEDIEVVGKEQTDKTPGQWLGEALLGAAAGAASGGVGAAASGSQVGKSASRGVAQSIVTVTAEHGSLAPALVGIATAGVAEKGATAAANAAVAKAVTKGAGELGLKRCAAALSAKPRSMPRIDE